MLARDGDELVEFWWETAVEKFVSVAEGGEVASVLKWGDGGSRVVDFGERAGVW